MGCKWVFFLIKQHPNGTIFKYKAHLVATSFHQHLDIDFHDTFSPIVKSTTFRVILTLALTNDWSLLHQLDVNNFFFFFFVEHYLKKFICNNYWVLLIKIIRPSCANYERQFTYLNRHREHGTLS